MLHGFADGKEYLLIYGGGEVVRIFFISHDVGHGRCEFRCGNKAEHGIADELSHFPDLVDRQAPLAAGVKNDLRGTFALKGVGHLAGKGIKAAFDLLCLEFGVQFHRWICLYYCACPARSSRRRLRRSRFLRPLRRFLAERNATFQFNRYSRR